MVIFMNYLGKIYLLLILISLILIFALVGYFVNKKKSKESPFKLASERVKAENMGLDLEATKQEVTSNIGLSEYVKDNATVTSDDSNNIDVL